MSAAVGVIELAVVAASAASDKLADDVVLVDVSSHLALADVFLICTVKSPRQAQAVIDEIEARLKADGHQPSHREGSSDGDWILLSYPEIVIHVMSTEAREFYRLESLWGDCEQIAIPELVRGRV